MPFREVNLNDGSTRVIDTGVSQEKSIIGQLPERPTQAEQAARGRTLDYDRGLIMMHGQNGMVAMYVDSPGDYINIQGQEVTEAEARLAGFNTLKLGTEKRRKEAQRKAYAEIERIHQAELAAIEAETAALIPEPEIESAPETVYAVPSKDADAVAADVLLANRKKS